MSNPRKFTAKAKFEGQFLPGTTRCSFAIGISEAQGVSIAAPFVKSFRHVMAELYPVESTRPVLRKITITILLP